MSGGASNSNTTSHICTSTQTSQHMNHDHEPQNYIVRDCKVHTFNNIAFSTMVAAIHSRSSSVGNNRPSRRRRRHQHGDGMNDQSKQLLIILVSIITLYFILHEYSRYRASRFFQLNDEDDNYVADRYITHQTRRNVWARKEWAEEGLPIKQNTDEQSGPSAARIHPAKIDTVIRYLTKLAHVPPTKLWSTIFGIQNNSYGQDPFSLQELESGKCPWSDKTTVDWLPPRPYNSDELALAYRDMMTKIKNPMTIRNRNKRNEIVQNIVIWYEHLSKAGGTTFCGLAQSNMLASQVPKYHCMPRKGQLRDGRVGSWTNDELFHYVVAEKHNVLSNEWDPFDLDKFELSGRQLDGSQVKKLEGGPHLLFLTTLRDPADRLLSAYTFFALTTTEGRREERNTNAPTFSQWISNNMGRLKNYKVGGTQAFRSNTARYNHITWRFSGGKLTHVRPLEESDWKSPFETAIRALSQHDLILPMDLMTQDGHGKIALKELLGWDKFEVKGRRRPDPDNSKGDAKAGHVVTTGGIKNSNAREYFSIDEFQQLWEENWLDNILYLWARAVFFARLNCKDILIE